MAKWDFKIVGASFVKELVPIADDVQPRSQSFMQPSFHLEGGKIVMKESGQYVTAIYFPQIGEIAGVAPADLEDAYDKLIDLVENFNGGGATSQTLAQTLASDNKTNQIPITSNDGTSSVQIDNNGNLYLQSNFGGLKQILITEEGFTFQSNIRYDISGKGILMNTNSDGFGLPILTTSQMNAIVLPTEGMIVWNTTETATYQYNGSAWEELARAPATGVTFNGSTVALGNRNGTAYNPYTQVGVLSITVSTSITLGFATLAITANGSAITVPVGWKNVGGDSISIVNGNVNRFIITQMNTEVWYTVKVN